jgi:hypothetical protein
MIPSDPAALCDKIAASSNRLIFSAESPRSVGKEEARYTATDGGPAWPVVNAFHDE